MSTLLSARGLTRTYVTHGSRRRGPDPTARAETLAVHGVHLDVADGETVGLVGRSGSGKTTLLRLLLALEAPDSGTISCRGRQLRPAGARSLRWFRRAVQYVPQDPATSLDPRATAVASVLEPLRRLGAPGTAKDHEHRARESLEAVGLGTELHNRRPSELSGGQAQRVAIARAMAVRPCLLVADEPVSGLDLPLRAQVVRLLQDVCAAPAPGGCPDDPVGPDHPDGRATGTALLVVSHDLSVVARLCRRVLVMHAGRVVEDRPTAALLATPEHPQTRLLLDAVPRLRGGTDSSPTIAATPAST